MTGRLYLPQALLLAACLAGCGRTSDETAPRGIGSVRLREDLGNGFFAYSATAPDGRETTLFANRADLDRGPPRSTLVFVTGSGYVSAFRRRPDGSLTHGMAGLFARYGPPGTTVVVPEKRGVEGFTAVGADGAGGSDQYLRYSITLAGRRDQMVEAVIGVARLPSVAGHRVILAGHSEGADVAAAAAARAGSRYVSHLVFLGSGGATQMLDVLLLARRHFADLDPARREEEIAALWGTFRSILERPEDLETWQGLPVRRWAGFFAHAPLDDLLALDGIPVFVGHGAEDEHVPIACADLIAVEFLRRGRENLTYRVYPGADHSFTGSEDALFGDVFRWIESAP